MDYKILDLVKHTTTLVYGVYPSKVVLKLKNTYISKYESFKYDFRTLNDFRRKYHQVQIRRSF